MAIQTVAVVETERRNEHDRVIIAPSAEDVKRKMPAPGVLGGAVMYDAG
jgi:hypothetical protein